MAVGDVHLYTMADYIYIVEPFSHTYIIEPLSLCFCFYFGCHLYLNTIRVCNIPVD